MRAPALVATAPGRTEVREVATLAPGPGRLRVRTIVSAASPGTDGWVVSGRFTWQPTAYPCIPGYQRVGVVEAVGDGVAGWAIGDRVVATNGPRDGDAVGSHWGGHAAVALADAHDVYRVPDEVADVDAAHLVVAQVGWNAAMRAAPQPGAWVAVVGDGVIGLYGAQAARARGARVAVVGRRTARLAIAERFGFAAVDARRGEVAARLRELAGGPVSAVIDTVQGVDAQASWIDALESAVGRVVYSGFTPERTWADMAQLQQRELTAHFVAGWSRARMDATLAAIARGELRATPLVTDRVPAARAPELFARIADKDPNVVGVAVDW